MKIELTDKEIKLLISVLKEASEERSSMGCNDAYSSEKKLFSAKERKGIAQKHLDYGKEELKDMGSNLANFDYVDYLINKIKKQVK